MSDVWRLVGGSPAPEGIRPPSLDDLLRQVSRGDEAAFERLYDQLAAPVFGLVRRVVRDRAQAEENTQEVMVEVWRTASRFDPARGSALSWVLTMAHRRAVDRVRSAQASTGREERAARMSEDVAYALHALPEHEERRFEEHMARCEACLLEVRGLREAAARLGLAAAEPPPPALRSRVLARIAEVRQEPPGGGGEAVDHRLGAQQLPLVAELFEAGRGPTLSTTDRPSSSPIRHAAFAKPSVSSLVDVTPAPSASPISARTCSGGSRLFVRLSMLGSCPPRRRGAAPGAATCPRHVRRSMRSAECIHVIGGVSPR